MQGLLFTYPTLKNAFNKILCLCNQHCLTLVQDYYDPLTASLKNALICYLNYYATTG
jgi:hypothetical protein